jgi:hypothetical protein
MRYRVHVDILHDEVNGNIEDAHVWTENVLHVEGQAKPIAAALRTLADDLDPKVKSPATLRGEQIGEDIVRKMFGAGPSEMFGTKRDVG